MKLSQFKFKLPETLIAQEAPVHRDECRLMVVHRKTGEIEHKEVKDIIITNKENKALRFFK